MNDLERDLAAALRRREPPAGFASRVMEKTGSKSPIAAWRRWGAIAAGCALIAVGAAEYRAQWLERARAKKAAGQLSLALQITAGKLELAQKKVLESGKRRHI